MFGGSFSVVGTALWRRVTRVRRWRRRLAQLLVALATVPLLAHDDGSTGPVDSDRNKFWHDLALPFLVLAATLPVWRAPEESLPDALRLRELHRRVCRRASVLLALAASCAPAFNHWYAWHGAPGAADTAAGVGAVLMLLALVPWLLLDPLLWLLWPAPVRRGVRAARTAEALYRPRPFRRSVVRFVPDPVLGSITDFDADLGASGRPRAKLHKPAGARSPGKCTAPSRARRRHKGPYLHWDGAALVEGDARGRIRTVPLADESRPGGVAELVWLEPQRRLLYLDRNGYLLARSPLGLRAQPGNLAQLAAAAGLTFNFYELSFWAETRNEQTALLFPRRWPLLRRRRTRPVGR